jgi:probable HAF family extracellular repeat protein
VALAVNSDGLVVGYADAAGDVHAITWSAGVGLTDLGTFPGTGSCAANNQPCSIARGVSDAGRIVGDAEVLHGVKLERDAFAINVGKQFTVVPPPSGPDITASTFKGGSLASLARINSHDHAAGYFCPANVSCTKIDAKSPTDAGYTNVRAVYYSLSGTWYVLPPFSSGDTSFATAINESNQVVGGANATPGGPLHAFVANVTSTNRQLLDLGSLGGPAAVAYAVNGAGAVVGSAQRADSTSHAALWAVPGSPPVDLGTLIPAGTAWTTLEVATGINDAGAIVGWGSVGGHRHAFLMLPAGATVTTTTVPASSTTTTLPAASSCETAACLLSALHGTLIAATPAELRGVRLRAKLEALVNRAVFQVASAGSDRSRARRLRVARRALRAFLATLRRGVRQGRIDSNLGLTLQALAQSALGELAAP